MNAIDQFEGNNANCWKLQNNAIHVLHLRYDMRPAYDVAVYLVSWLCWNPECIPYQSWSLESFASLPSNKPWPKKLLPKAGLSLGWTYWTNIVVPTGPSLSLTSYLIAHRITRVAIKIQTRPLNMTHISSIEDRNTYYIHMHYTCTMKLTSS